MKGTREITISSQRCYVCAFDDDGNISRAASFYDWQNYSQNFIVLEVSCRFLYPVYYWAYPNCIPILTANNLYPLNVWQRCERKASASMIVKRIFFREKGCASFAGGLLRLSLLVYGLLNTWISLNTISLHFKNNVTKKIKLILQIKMFVWRNSWKGCRNTAIYEVQIKYLKQLAVTSNPIISTSQYSKWLLRRILAIIFTIFSCKSTKKTR